MKEKYKTEQNENFKPPSLEEFLDSRVLKNNLSRDYRNETEFPTTK